MIIRWDIILCYSLSKDSALISLFFTIDMIIQHDERKKEKLSGKISTSGYVRFNDWNRYKKYCLHGNIFQFYIITEMKKSISINMDITFRCYT